MNSIIQDKFLIDVIREYSFYKYNYEKLANKLNKIKNDINNSFKKCKICDKYDYENVILKCDVCNIHFCQRKTCMYFLCGDECSFSVCTNCIDISQNKIYNRLKYYDYRNLCMNCHNN